MKKLNYYDLVFIENALTYYCIHEVRIMKENLDIYPDEEITKFRSSIKELIDKVVELREGE